MSCLLFRHSCFSGVAGKFIYETTSFSGNLNRAIILSNIPLAKCFSIPTYSARKLATEPETGACICRPNRLLMGNQSLLTSRICASAFRRTTGIETQSWYTNSKQSDICKHKKSRPQKETRHKVHKYLSFCVIQTRKGQRLDPASATGNHGQYNSVTLMLPVWSARRPIIRSIIQVASSHLQHAERKRRRDHQYH